MADENARFCFRSPVTLIGGGVVDKTVLAQARSRAPVLVAADGGANAFRTDRSALAAVVGDLDSLQDVEAWRDALGARVVELTEQETTDFEKCLYSVDAPYYLAVGFLGGQWDHSLSAVHMLLKRYDRRVILLGDEELLFLAPRRWRISLPVKSRVSLFPLRRVEATRSAGLRWGLDGVTLEIGAQVGTSNETASPDVEMDLAGESAWSSLVVSLDRAHLGAALESLGFADQGEEKAT